MDNQGRDLAEYNCTTDAARPALVEIYGQCQYCVEHICPECREPLVCPTHGAVLHTEFHVDHIVPRSAPDELFRQYHPDPRVQRDSLLNYTLACPRHNVEKSDHLWTSFVSLLLSRASANADIALELVRGGSLPGAVRSLDHVLGGAAPLTRTVLDQLSQWWCEQPYRSIGEGTTHVVRAPGKASAATLKVFQIESTGLRIAHDDNTPYRSRQYVSRARDELLALDRGFREAFPSFRRGRSYYILDLDKEMPPERMQALKTYLAAVADVLHRVLSEY